MSLPILLPSKTPIGLNGIKTGVSATLSDYADALVAASVVVVALTGAVSDDVEAEIALLTDVEAGVFDVENHPLWVV
jgi:hypothetical protein